MIPLALDKAKFPLGRLLATPGVLDAIPEEDMRRALDRHLSGDWGDTHPEDDGLNDQALIDGTRLLSVYDAHGVKFWIITEADRASTTVLLPEEY